MGVKLYTRRDLAKLLSIGIAGTSLGSSGAITRSARALRCSMIGASKKEETIPYFDVNPSKSGSTVWFNTGYVPTNNTRMEMCVQFDSKMRSFLSCGRRLSWPPRYAYQIHVNGKWGQSCYIAWNTSNQECSIGYPSGMGVFSLYQGKLFYNGDVVKTYSDALQSNDLPIWFCNINQNGSAADGGLYGRFFWGKIYENEELVHHYIPQPDLTLKDIIGGTTLSKIGYAEIVYGEKSDNPEPERPAPTGGNVYYCGPYGDFYETDVVVGTVVSGSVESGEFTIKFNGADEVNGCDMEISFSFNDWYASSGSIGDINSYGEGTFNLWSVDGYWFDIYLKATQSRQNHSSHTSAHSPH